MVNHVVHARTSRWPPPATATTRRTHFTRNLLAKVPKSAYDEFAPAEPARTNMGEANPTPALRSADDLVSHGLGEDATSIFVPA